MMKFNRAFFDSLQLSYAAGMLSGISDLILLPFQTTVMFPIRLHPFALCHPALAILVASKPST